MNAFRWRPIPFQFTCTVHTPLVCFSKSNEKNSMRFDSISFESVIKRYGKFSYLFAHMRIRKWYFIWCTLHVHSAHWHKNTIRKKRDHAWTGVAPTIAVLGWLAGWLASEKLVTLYWLFGIEKWTKYVYCSSCQKRRFRALITWNVANDKSENTKKIHTVYSTLVKLEQNVHKA